MSPTQTAPRLIAAISVLFTIPLAAQAQSTGKVATPEIHPGESNMDMRYVIDPDAEFARYRWHVQHGWNADWRTRFVVEGSRAADGEPLITAVRGEILRSLIASKGPGLTSSLQIAAGAYSHKPADGRFGVAWLNQYQFESGWRWRGYLSANQDFGDEAAEGLALAARTEVTAHFSENARLGGQVYSSFNRTSQMGAFKDQKHQAGPVLKWKPTRKLGLEFSAHYALSDAAPDAVYRIFADVSF